MLVPYDNLIAALQDAADPDAAAPMAAYMRDQFLFLGINKPARQKLCKAFFKASKAAGKTDGAKAVDWEFVDLCWNKPQREFQYVACDYLSTMKEYLKPSDLPKIKKLVSAKSWWDTTDNLDVTAGFIAMQYPKVKDTLLKWSKDKDFWVRRVARDHQLTRKEDTDEQLLAQILENNLPPLLPESLQDEFFINKAVGWALRDYSKTNPDWVRKFIDEHRDVMSKLSIREGSKYL
ncbi:MAG: DNA alkylation repair protein [Coriobacteriales bacterium]|jgi:3-methyladenine DNA glycosylase AlkD|nr:DNA alkylation repair protein [Coriobacteriales bacterium]